MFLLVCRSPDDNTEGNAVEGDSSDEVTGETLDVESTEHIEVTGEGDSTEVEREEVEVTDESTQVVVTDERASSTR